VAAEIVQGGRDQISDRVSFPPRRRRRLARVRDAGEWGTERRKSDSARGRSAAAVRERSFASSSIHAGFLLFVRSEESIPRRG